MVVFDSARVLTARKHAHLAGWGCFHHLGLALTIFVYGGIFHHGIAARAAETPETEFADLFRFVNERPVFRSGTPDLERTKITRDSRIKQVEACLAFYIRHPNSSLRWDAVALGYAKRGGYVDSLRMLTDDRKPRDLEGFRYAGQTLAGRDPFLTSGAGWEISELAEKGLKAADIHPITFAFLAAAKVDRLRDGDYPSYVDMVRDDFADEVLREKVAQVGALVRAIEDKIPTDAVARTAVRHGHAAWSIDSRYQHAIHFYLRMVKRTRSQLEYQEELVRVTQVPLPGSAEYARGLLRKVASIGSEFPMAFIALDGSRVDVAEMRGKVILVEFWATWCGPCVERIPSLKELYRKYRAAGFEIVGVSLDREKDRKKVRDFCAENELTWPQHFDGAGWQGKLVTMYGITGIPAMFLIGREGRMIATELATDVVEPAVRKALGLLPHENAVEIVPYGMRWSYSSGATPVPPDWASQPAATWKSGVAPLGYDGTGEYKVSTALEFGPDRNEKRPVYYFSREFDVPAELAGRPFVIRLRCDDGAAVYVNGREIGRINLSAGSIGPDTLAVDAGYFQDAEIQGGDNLLQPGRNVVAASVHQTSRTSSDLLFDLQLYVLKPQAIRQ